MLLTLSANVSGVFTTCRHSVQWLISPSADEEPEARRGFQTWQTHDHDLEHVGRAGKPSDRVCALLHHIPTLDGTTQPDLPLLSFSKPAGPAQRDRVLCPCIQHGDRECVHGRQSSVALRELTE